MSDRKPLVKDYAKEGFLFSQRAWVAFVLVCLLSSCLVLRFLYLQVVQHALYTTLSRHNRIKILPIAPKRGLITDRNGVLLARNKAIFSLDITPSEVQNLKNTLHGLAQILPISPTEIQTFYKQRSLHKPYQPIPLKIKLTEKEMARFHVNQYQFPGVHIHARLLRQYPLGPIMAHVVGHVGRMTQQDLHQIHLENYSATHYIGKTGIEGFFEDDLHGTTGYQQVETNANGQVIRILEEQPALSGQDMQLSIDSRLQTTADQALGDNEGAVVVMDTRNGQILALVSKPSYDPNLFISGMSLGAFHALMADEHTPLFNRAVSGQFPPASTLKPFMALSALDHEAITPKDIINDPGWYQLPHSHHIYWDWRHSGHGKVDLHKAIAISCDTYFYRLSTLLGIRHMASTLRQLGLGQKTGIELQEEYPGLVPDPEWKKMQHGEPWYIGDSIITIIGQGYTLVTPLQLAVSTAILANHGVHIQPTLLLNQPIKTAAPLSLKHPWIWQTIIQAMHAVITQGTASHYFKGHEADQIAGKTGTAQLYRLNNLSRDQLPKKLRDHSLFIAFAPINTPKIAISVVVAHDRSAPAVAKKVIEAYMNQQPYTGIF